jgi:hypothetical protein
MGLLGSPKKDRGCQPDEPADRCPSDSHSTTLSLFDGMPDGSNGYNRVPSEGLKPAGHPPAHVS